MRGRTSVDPVTPGRCLRAVVLGSALLWGAGRLGAAERPNILFILADDHTTQAISCYGGYLAPWAATQHIDRLASEGVRLTQAFCTNSICSPSRATILTGQYSHVNGVRCLDQPLDPKHLTFPRLFQRAGYQTALYGKWHLKNRPQGFDDYKILKRQGRYPNPQFLVPGRSDEDLETIPGWSTDIIADLTIQAIRGRDPARPFLIGCQFKATHDPWDSRAPYKSLWADGILPEPNNLLDTYANRSEAARRTTLKLEFMNQSTYPHRRLPGAAALEQRRFIYRQYIRDFLRCGRVLDENVGRILDVLRAEDLERDTVVVYTADQGHFLGEHGFFSKRFMYDESMRMPFLIRWPGHLPAGAVNADLIANVDFAPTLLDVAGLPVPAAMQGRSFLPNLRGQRPADWRQAIYYRYWQHLLHRRVAAHYGIRTCRYKLIFYYGRALGQTDFGPTEPEWELFDLARDPQEMHDVYAEPAYGPVVTSLQERLRALRAQVGDTDEAYPEMRGLGTDSR